MAVYQRRRRRTTMGPGVAEEAEFIVQANPQGIRGRGQTSAGCAV
jgi:hypothetical protein